MIALDMRLYSFYALGGDDGYGQPQMPTEPTGTIKMAINTTSQAIQDNINYKDASYIGLTLGDINDKCVIDYNGEKLKVLYINPRGRYKAVFMKSI
jgi:hypothetical protein